QQARAERIAALRAAVERTNLNGRPLADVLRRPEFTATQMLEALGPAWAGFDAEAAMTVHTEFFYAVYLRRGRAEAARMAEAEHRRIPPGFDFASATSLRPEARQALERFRPATLGQAGRLEGVTPADLTLLAVLVSRHGRSPGSAVPSGA
ncbi:MAG: tRNA uridine-5-carboxymethylaminomethyl(34) synthesis enzyme MnmG, partial [Phycisphaerae bacterium]|nr:tRNA uridine-5-carboxymethylaminomethyl(34) synthesis enzyme MnmG [Phycisphaerae bacterium]